MFARSGGHTKLTNIPFQENIFPTCFTHQFWPPRTSLDSFWAKITLPTAENQPDATALMQNAILAKTSKKKNILSKKSKMVNLGGGRKSERVSGAEK